MVKLDWPNPPFQEDDLPPYDDSVFVDAYLAYLHADARFEMLGSVSINATICLYCNRGTPLSFWNPVTHEFKSIPPSPIKQVVANNRGARFGYDYVEDDYKVDIPRSYDNRDVYMNSVCHWLSKTEKHFQLVSFNFNNESVLTTPIPSYVDDSFGWFLKRRLVLLNGSIAFILNISGHVHFTYQFWGNSV
ncbi:hypothetical protein MtrunA17_Chr5g0442951 [Medicago truncatula]|uniref:Uncharacterized protein n=1 Tax=Medicago truncatula TaxID=3880 RepID=A0A396HYS4_MEDTR|nr:hypothetical protein MtrunA17_Chr5g0442951 [Medicago truncatula]